jgi:mono/diheme cytochrome c family protein
MDSTPGSGGRRRLVVIAVAVSAGALIAAGCGSVGYLSGNGDRGKGKELFTQKCGSCHTLADAGTQGQIGPNLDYAFLASRRDGLGESSIVQVVRGQIAYAVVKPSTGAPGMPRNLVTGQDADDVASYVGAVAGVGAGASGGATQTPAAPPSTGSSGSGSSGGASGGAGGSSGASGGTTTSESGGGAATGDAAAGKAVFTSAGCVSCHTLADAGAKGTVGPNLDEAKPDAALVTDRVTNGKGVMPPFKGQLSDQQIKDVAAYVSSVAGT